MNKRLGGFALLSLLVAACGPSIDPAARADIDRRVAALQIGANTVPRPTSFEPMPLAPGQWTQYKMIDDKGHPSFLTQKIVGEEAGAHWIETLHESYTGRTSQRMLVAFGNRMDPGQVQIRAVKMKDSSGKVTEMPPEVIGML